jgi:hypothetical protein
MIKENKSFFDNLPQADRSLIDALFRMGVGFAGYMAMAFNAKGVDFNQGKLYKASAEPVVTQGRETVDGFRAQALAEAQNYERAKRGAGTQ